MSSPEVETPTSRARSGTLQLLGNELATQFRRLRTWAMLAALALIPILLGIAIRVFGGSRPGRGPAFLDQIADKPKSDTDTYAPMASSRSSPSPIDTWAPESSVTGPTGKRIQPTSTPTTTTVTVAAMQKAAAERYFTSSRRTRPAGAISR